MSTVYANRHTRTLQTLYKIQNKSVTQCLLVAGWKFLDCIIFYTRYKMVKELPFCNICNTLEMKKKRDFYKQENLKN